MSISSVEAVRKLGEQRLGELEIGLRSDHGLVAEVGREQRQLGVEVLACLVPRLEAIYGKGVTNLMEARSSTPTAMDDTGAIEKFSKDSVDPLMAVLAASRRREEGFARCARAQHIGVALETAAQARGNRDDTIPAKLTLVDPENP